MSDSVPQGDQPSAHAPRYQPLVVVLAAVAAGIVADRGAAIPVGMWWTVAAAAWIGWFVLWRRGLDRTAAAVLLAAAAACGGAWHHCRWHRFAEDDLGYYARLAAQPVCVEAVALTGPRRQVPPPSNPMRGMPPGERTRVEVELAGLRNGPDWQTASGRARLFVDGHLAGVHAGDRLRIFARLRAMRPAGNPGEFDFAAHDRADRKRCLLQAEFPDCVEVVQSAASFSLAHAIENLRTGGDRLLGSYLDERRSGLAAAILLGAREEVGAEQTEAFMETGTVHVLSISGLHVGIVAGVMFFLMRLLAVPRTWSVLLVSLSTVAYTIVTDAEPPAVRAAILVLITCAGYPLGRRPLALNSLAAAGLVVLALNPADLFRTGVQLSFLCVAGLMWFGPRLTGAIESRQTLDRLAWRARPWPLRLARVMGRRVWHLTFLGAVVWLLTAPLVLARFHLFSPVALVLNTILWLPMTLAIVTGFAVLALGWLLPPLGAASGWCCDATFWLLEVSIDWARRLPGSYFWLPGPADWWLVGFYGGLALLAAFPAIRPPRRWCLALAAGWTGLGLAAGAIPAGKPHLQCAFLSVEHGAATVVELPSGATILVDAGQFASPEAGTRSIAPYLWSRGIVHLDAVFLSHPDADHYNALPGLLERFSVGVVYVPPGMFEDSHPAILALQNAIRQAKAPIRETCANCRFRGGEDCRIEVRHPPPRGVLASDNANSLVLAIEYRGHRILLPGDLEPPGLEDLVAEEPWHCDVLLAPHHGSRRANPGDLADWCTPHWAVISEGHRFRTDETKALFQSAGIRPLQTGDVGAIHVRIDAAGLSVSTGADARPLSP